MALPISAGEVLQVAKFAYDLWKKCRAASDEFDQIGKEVFAMRTVISLVHIDCENPRSLLNQVDDRQGTIRKQLKIHISNCQQALKDVDTLLKRYVAMSWYDKAKWALGGREEVASLKSDLSSFATQLDSWVNSLTYKGVGLVNNNINKGFARLGKGLGRIEQAVEKNDGDEKAAVAEIIADLKRSGINDEDSKEYQPILAEYAQQCSTTIKATEDRPVTPDPPRGRGNASSTLLIPTERPRANSNAKSEVSSKAKRKNSRFSAKKKSPLLECWLVKHKSVLTLELTEKELQTRGQCKLREMTQQFKALKGVDKLSKDDHLVQWVLKDRRKDEKKKDYTWVFSAAKLERKGSALLGLGVEQQTMIIIERKLTAEAQKKADDKLKAAKAKKGKGKEKKKNQRKTVPTATKDQKGKTHFSKDQKPD